MTVDDAYVKNVATLYSDIQLILSAGNKLLPISRKKLIEIETKGGLFGKKKIETPHFIKKGMLEQLKKDGLHEELYYPIQSLTSEANTHSVVELCTRFNPRSKQKILTTMEQFDYLFEPPIFIMNPSETKRTLCMSTFTPVLCKKIFCFLYEF